MFDLDSGRGHLKLELIGGIVQLVRRSGIVLDGLEVLVKELGVAVGHKALSILAHTAAAILRSESLEDDEIGAAPRAAFTAARVESETLAGPLA